MKNGWKEVARLGLSKDGYPHVLVDAYGWSLRLGPSRTEQKYFSNLPSLLRGLTEHWIRRRLRECPLLATVQAMNAEVRSALEKAEEFGRKLAGTLAQESSIRRFQPLEPPVPPPETSDHEQVA
jgi:hypothetical protein